MVPLTKITMSQKVEKTHLPPMKGFAPDPINKCCCCLPAPLGLNLSLILNMATVAIGYYSLYKGDPASLYGASQEVVDEITKDMDKEGEEYKFWVAMQSIIWYNYIILCNFNMLCFAKWLFNDCYNTRMLLAISNGALALISLWNTVMGFLGYYYTPPEVFLLVCFLHFTFVAVNYANELSD